MSSMQRSLPPAADRAGLGLVIAGFVFAALSGVLLLLAAIPAVVIGILCLRQGRVPAGTAIIVIAVALPAAIVVAVVKSRTFRSPSESMVPTIVIGERFLTTDLGSPGRGDIIVFRPPGRS